MRHPDAACRSGVATQIHMKIYTDGGCDRNGHPDAIGAWAFVASDGHEDFGAGESGTTNNRMELLAVIKALLYAKAQHAPRVTIYSDSQMTMLCAIGRWKRRANLDLWDQFRQAVGGMQAKFVWVRGHSGVAGNERADELCSMVMADMAPAPEIAHLRSILAE